MELLKSNFKLDTQLQIYNTYAHQNNIAGDRETLVRKINSFTDARFSYLMTVITIGKRLQDGADWNKFLVEFDKYALVYLSLFTSSFLADCFVTKAEKTLNGPWP